MNFYFGQSRFVKRLRKKKKEKKKEEISNVKTHVEAIRISMVEFCGMKRSRFLLDTRFHFFFLFFSYRRQIERNCIFIFSLLSSLPRSLIFFFFFFFWFSSIFLFFLFVRTMKIVTFSSRNDFSRLINRMALSLGDSYNRFSYTH